MQTNGVSPLPEIKLPPQPELVMSGVVAQFTPTIMKTSLGGFIVVVPGKGVSACTGMDEVMAFLEREAYPALEEDVPVEHEDKPELPAFYDKWEAEKPRGSRALNVVAALAFMAFSIFSVKGV